MEIINYSGQTWIGYNIFEYSITVRNVDFMHLKNFPDAEYQINLIISKAGFESNNNIFAALIPLEKQELSKRQKEAQKVKKYFLGNYRYKNYNSLVIKLKANPIVEIDGFKYAVRWLLN